jgi:hypothetical protein
MAVVNHYDGLDYENIIRGFPIYEFSVKKDGKFGNRLYPVSYTRLNNCERCYRLGSNRFVQYRSHLAKWLCMGCWNKLRGLKSAEYESLACKTLINQLKKAISNERKNQNDRGNA